MVERILNRSVLATAAAGVPSRDFGAVVGDGRQVALIYIEFEPVAL
jgi:hypothetical protein